MDAPEKESVHASCCIRMEEIAKSVIVRADDFQHLIENLFHLPHQCELGAGAVEVVIRASNMEIMVALQIVSQKTDAAFQRHEPCTPCKALFFCHAHGCPGSGEIPFGEHFVQMQVKMDFALVRFVLSAVVGTGADGIAEVVGRKSRHHGVEVNDTDAFSGSGIDAATGKGICVIDLDTVMPGLSAYDFGDSIRTGANDCAEDEPDQSKVHFDLHLYEVFAKGYLSTAGASMSMAEKKSLAWGARLMTLECGIRFLTDYLEGDHYFHIARPDHNLDRARTQFTLVRQMEEVFDQMLEIVCPDNH